MFEATNLIVTAIAQLDKESLEETGSPADMQLLQDMDRMQRLAGGRAIEGIELFYAILQHCTRKNIRSRIE